MCHTPSKISVLHSIDLEANTHIKHMDLAHVVWCHLWLQRIEAGFTWRFSYCLIRTRWRSFRKRGRSFQESSSSFLGSSFASLISFITSIRTPPQQISHSTVFPTHQWTLPPHAFYDFTITQYTTTLTETHMSPDHDAIHPPSHLSR